MKHANSLDANTINEILAKIWTHEKRRLHSAKIAQSWTINGCKMARKLSRILDEAVVGILEAMELPEEVTIVAVGANGREEPTVRSDLDLICYVPNTSDYEGSFTGPYQKTMWWLHAALGLDGEPTVWVPWDFRTDDLLNIASMNLDARLIYGGKNFTMAEIQKRVRAVCEPIVIASQHELALHKFIYARGEWGRGEYSVDFDIKKDRWGLRHLQHTLWFVAAMENTSLQNLYKTVKTESPEVYEALDLMLHIRSWLHLTKQKKDKKIDLLYGTQWTSLQEQFGEDIIDRISNARACIISYERTRIPNEKKKGIKIGDGTRYGEHGLAIDHTSWEGKNGIVINLLTNTQKTGLKIDPLEFNTLVNEARKYMTWPDENWALLLKERGNFSTSIRRLNRFGIMKNIFPEFNILNGKKFPTSHRHSHTTRMGRVIERLENLEHIIENDQKDIYSELDDQAQTGIRIALACRDVFDLAEVSRRDYFKNLEKLYPSLESAVKTAEALVKNDKMLFECWNIDDWYDSRELEREAAEIGSPELLNAQLIYTCALLDYGKPEYFTKSQWDKTYALYYELKKELEWKDPEKLAEYGKLATVRKLSLSPEQQEILDTAPQTFLHSRYVSASESLAKSMRCLEKAREKWEPQITISRTHSDTIRIIVSTRYDNNLPAIISGVCLENKIAIEDAEIHTFGADGNLAILFLEGCFSIPWLTNPGKEEIISRLSKQLQDHILTWKMIDIDPLKILEESEPQYLLEETKKTGKYKLMVTAEKNTPGFLYALTRMIAECGVKILSTSVYTHPRNHWNTPIIEDIFILGGENIENLKEKIQF